LAPSVIIELQNQLPNRFNLVFSALPFGRNAGQDLRVKIGSHAYNFKLRSKLFEYSQLIDLGGEKVTAIEFIPPNPTFSGPGNDSRKLGIGLVRLRFETNFKN